VLNPRTGARSVAYGDPSSLRRRHGAALHAQQCRCEGRRSADHQRCGRVYPSGLPVAKVVKVERRADSAFARIYCEPVARLQARAT
jgi:rod shape-determining protein MreC